MVKPLNSDLTYSFRGFKSDHFIVTNSFSRSESFWSFCLSLASFSTFFTEKFLFSFASGGCETRTYFAYQSDLYLFPSRLKLVRMIHTPVPKPNHFNLRYNFITKKPTCTIGHSQSRVRFYSVTEASLQTLYRVSHY